MSKGYKRIVVLLVENGYLRKTRLVDFGSFLGQEISQDKWRAWAKGKPLLLKSKFGSRYTYIVTPEVGWTLDGDSIVNIMMKGKESIAPKFSGAPTYKLLPNGTKAVQPPKLTGVMTNDDVSKLIDEKLHNGFKKELLDEIRQLLAPKVEPPAPPIAANDAPAQPVNPQTPGEPKPPLEPIPIIGPPIAVTQPTTTEVKESK
jgi:hypothetical protein